MSSVPQVGVATLHPQVAAPKNLHKHTWIALTVGVALIYLAFLPPGIYSVDGNAMLAVAESLVTHHSFAVAPDMGVVGRGGQSFSKWYPLQSMLAVPLVAAGTEIAHALRLPTHYVAAVSSLVLPILLTAVTGALVARISEQLGASKRGAFLAALTYAFGTMAMVYARTFYAEPLLALLTAACMYLALAGSPAQILWAGALAALAVLAKPTGIVVGLALAAYLFFGGKRRWLSLIPAAGSALGLLLYFAYNQMRFGHALTFGQPWAFHINGVAEGVAGLLVSPGRGLMWYSPAVVLAIAALRKIKNSSALLIAGVFVGFLGIHSVWSFWHGGWSWGPRFLLPALPGLVALLGILEGGWRRALVVLAIMGFLINAPTLFTFYERYYAEANERGVSERDLLWSFSEAPFLHGWSAAVRQVQDAQGADVRGLLSERGSAPATTIGSSRALRIVAVWWWVLPVAGIPRLVGVSVSLVLVGLGCWALWRQDKILEDLRTF